MYNSLHAPHSSPSASILRTCCSTTFISVSSSQGLTSNIILDLAITAGSKRIEYNKVNRSLLYFYFSCRDMLQSFLV